MKKLSEIQERNSTYMTRTINDTIAENEQFAKEVTEAIQRHFNNDFGDLVQHGFYGSRLLPLVRDNRRAVAFGDGGCHIPCQEAPRFCDY